MPVHILLVEDGYPDVRWMQIILGEMRLSYTMDVAATGDVALQMLRKEGKYESLRSPDLIFLDLNMPRLDGSEVLEEIKQDAALSRIPVCVLSGSQPDLIRVAKALKSEPALFLQKPISADKVLECCRRFESLHGVAQEISRLSRDATA